MRCSADVSCRTLSLAAMPCSRCETATEPKVGGSNPSGRAGKAPQIHGFLGDRRYAGFLHVATTNWKTNSGMREEHRSLRRAAVGRFDRVPTRSFLFRRLLRTPRFRLIS